MNQEAKQMVFEALELAESVEEVLDGKEMYIILMALTKVAGVMLAESRGISQHFEHKSDAIEWFSMAVDAAYEGHMAFMKNAEGKMH